MERISPPAHYLGLWSHKPSHWTTINNFRWSSWARCQSRQCVSSILVQLFKPYNWCKLYLPFIFLASFKRNATFQYNYCFKAFETLLCKVELQKSLRSILSVFHLSWEGKIKNGGVGGGWGGRDNIVLSFTPLFCPELLSCLTSPHTLPFQSMTEKAIKI